ncbi:MAG TPA: hypothetical protein VFZ89_04845 [Solirubrobacteraceae bacterium]
MIRTLAVALVAVALAGCGGGDGGGGGGDPAVATKRGLDRALEAYREGDRGDAAERFEDTRDDHFSRLEPELRDERLARRLHAALYDEVPRLIDEGVTVSALAARLAAIQADIDRAR